MPFNPGEVKPTPISRPTYSEILSEGWNAHSLGQFDEAMAQAVYVIQNAPGDTPDQIRERMNAFFLNGVLHYDMGQFELAVGVLNVALKLDPSNAAALYYRVVAHGSPAQVTAAEEQLALLRK